MLIKGLRKLLKGFYSKVFQSRLDLKCLLNHLDFTSRLLTMALKAEIAVEALLAVLCNVCICFETASAAVAMVGITAVELSKVVFPVLITVFAPLAPVCRGAKGIKAMVSRLVVSTGKRSIMHFRASYTIFFLSIIYYLLLS